MSCSATVQIDDRGGPFTNLDILRGKVHVKLKSEMAVKNIVVKMEGVTKTVVPISELDENRRDRRKESKHDAIEIHKLLYKTMTVFPPQDVAKSSSSNQFTLPAGEYTYDFQFKIPLKTACAKSGTTQGGLLGQIVFNAGGLDYARGATGHVDGLLPPSLSGFGDAATVKYFIKATVNKASMFRMNTRVNEPFVLLPMDVPLIDENKTAFVRREVGMKMDAPTPSGNSRSKGKGKLFGGFFNQEQFSNMMGINPSTRGGGRRMMFSFEARYPKTGSMRAVAPLPVQLFMMFPYDPRSQQSEIKTVQLRDLKVTLYAITDCRAQEHSKSTELSLSLYDNDRLSESIDISQATESQARNPNGQPMYQVPINPAIMHGIQIPDYVPPTFTTCNIQRQYKLVIRAGFQVNPNVPPEYAVLNIDALVQSGIPVPQGGASASSATMASSPPAMPARPNGGNEKQRPVDSSGPAAEMTSEGQEIGTDESLPSYNDAVADSVAGSSSGEAQQQQPRRGFAQSGDYYKNLDSYD